MNNLLFDILCVVIKTFVLQFICFVLKKVIVYLFEKIFCKKSNPKIFIHIFKIDRFNRRKRVLVIIIHK